MGGGKRIIRIYDLAELYDIAPMPSETAADLLLKILEYYKLTPRLRGDVVYGTSPDVGTYALDINTNKISHYSFNVDDVLRDCPTVVELWDGYEFAWACLE
jgi:hypothetical protein